MIIIYSRPKGGNDDTSMSRYCPGCYEELVVRAQTDGELRGLPLKINPDQHLSITVPAYIVVNGDVLIFWKKEKEAKP
jgi:hypothetical protein